MLWSLLHSLLQASTAFCSWCCRPRGHDVRSSPSPISFALWACHTFSWSPFSLCSCQYVRGTGWPPSISGKRTFQWRLICFSSLSSLLVTWHGLPVPSSVLWPLHGSAGLHLGHGSCFSFTPFSGYPYASIPRHLAGPVFLSGVSPRGSSTCPPTLSSFWDCHPSQVFQPHTFPGSAVSVGRLRFHLFQGFSVGGTHLSAAICNRRIYVMRLDYREPVAVASRHSFFASSPSSGRLAFFLSWLASFLAATWDCSPSSSASMVPGTVRIWRLQS